MLIQFEKGINEKTAHAVMLAKLEKTISELGYNKSFLSSLKRNFISCIENKEYSKGLRRLCATHNAKNNVKKLIIIMLEYSLILEIRPKDKKQNHQSAIDMATNKPEILSLLQAADKAINKKEALIALANNYKKIKIKEIMVDMPLRRVPAEDESIQEYFRENPDDFGVYKGWDEITGPLVITRLPSRELYSESLQLLRQIVFQIRACLRDYQNSDEKDLVGHYLDYLRDSIKEDVFVKWHLIPVLLDKQLQARYLEDRIIEACDEGYDIPSIYDDDISPQVLKDSGLFERLVAQGAEYKHYLSFSYGFVNQNTINSLFLFDKTITAPAEDGTNLLLSTLITHDFSNNSLKTTRALLNAGLNINDRMENHFGNTLLHYLIALEISNLTDYIQLMEEIRIENPEIPPLDYTLQDKQGKTALFLAVGLRLTKIVDEILAVKDILEVIDVGINIADEFGRTPLMIAAALRDNTTYNKLIQRGADINAIDKQGRSVAWYKNAPEEEIKAILRFVSIDPDRGCRVTHSHAYLLSDSSSPPLVMVDQTGKECLLPLSPKKPSKDLLKAAIILAERQTRGDFLYSLKGEISSLSKKQQPDNNKTIFEQILETETVKEGLASDGFAPPGKTLDYLEDEYPYPYDLEDEYPYPYDDPFARPVV